MGTGAAGLSMPGMTRWLWAVLAVLLLAGCSSGSSGGGSATAVSSYTDMTPASVAPPPDFGSADQAAAAACADFRAFLSDMETAPPREQVPRLLKEAGRVDNDAAAADNLGAGYGDLRAAADALLAYVARPDFAEQGNIYGGPVARMQDRC